MTAEPIATTVKRWKCPHCNRHFSRKPSAIAHVERCWLDPAKRTCRTCVHHVRAYTAPASDWCFPGRQCDCNDMDEHCDAPAADPDAELVFPVIGCPLWELKDGAP